MRRAGRIRFSHRSRNRLALLNSHSVRPTSSSEASQSFPHCLARLQLLSSRRPTTSRWGKFYLSARSLWPGPRYGFTGRTQVSCDGSDYVQTAPARHAHLSRSEHGKTDLERNALDSKTCRCTAQCLVVTLAWSPLQRCRRRQDGIQLPSRKVILSVVRGQYLVLLILQLSDVSR